MHLSVRGCSAHAQWLTNIITPEEDGGETGKEELLIPDADSEPLAGGRSLNIVVGRSRHLLE